MTFLSPREFEQISRLLDGDLPEAQAALLRARLEREPDLQETYTQINQARTLLRHLPPRRAPRNFRLTRQMAGVRPPAPRLFFGLQWASALTALLFVFSLGINTLAGNFGRTASAPPPESAAMPFAAESLPEATAAAPALAAPLQAPAPAAETPDSNADARLAPETSSAKSFPEALPTPDETQPTPPHLPAQTPLFLAAASLILAGLAGGLRWRAEQKFKQGGS